jgi:hypothetical protein
LSVLPEQSATKAEDSETARQVQYLVKELANMKGLNVFPFEVTICLEHYLKPQFLISNFGFDKL